MVMQNFQSVVNSCITLTLATAFLIIGMRRIDSVIKVVIVQAFLLMALCLILGWATGIYEMYFAALLTLVVKVGIIPYVLSKVAGRVNICREVKSYISMKMSFLICACLVSISFFSTSQVIGKGSGLIHEALPTAISLMLIGLFIMMNRKLAIMQIVGFVLMENGLFLAGIGTTNGMPLAIELGIFLDILVGVLIMGVLVFRINRSFDNIDTQNLRNLRG
ncbi:MAG TPA: hydrogenase [Desulfitobacteriaceae bacterium]|nr:hydrogenase [Desulfitobacteriaceae bacterium]